MSFINILDNSDYNFSSSSSNSDYIDYGSPDEDPPDLYYYEYNYNNVKKYYNIIIKFMNSLLILIYLYVIYKIYNI